MARGQFVVWITEKLTFYWSLTWIIAHNIPLSLVIREGTSEWLSEIEREKDKKRQKYLRFVSYEYEDFFRLVDSWRVWEIKKQEKE